MVAAEEKACPKEAVEGEGWGMRVNVAWWLLMLGVRLADPDGDSHSLSDYRALG